MVRPLRPPPAERTSDKRAPYPETVDLPPPPAPVLLAPPPAALELSGVDEGPLELLLEAGAGEAASKGPLTPPVVNRTADARRMPAGAFAAPPLPLGPEALLLVLFVAEGEGLVVWPRGAAVGRESEASPLLPGKKTSPSDTPRPPPSPAWLLWLVEDGERRGCKVGDFRDWADEACD